MRYLANVGKTLLILAGAACSFEGRVIGGIGETGGSGTGDSGIGQTDDGDVCPVGSLDCPCSANDLCEDGLVCDDDLCVPDTCGNGEVDDGEECDDGNKDATDDCDIFCKKPGTQQWEVVIDGPASAGDEAEAVLVDAAGDLVVVGHVTADPDTNARDIWMGKFSSEGETLWTTLHDDSGMDDRGYGVASLQGGDFVAVGMVGRPDSKCDVWVSRLGPNGGAVWTRTHDDVASECDVAFGVAVSGEGFTVTGHVNASEGVSRAWTREYTLSGDDAWTQTWGDQVDGLILGQSVATLPNGDLVVGGYVDPGPDDDVGPARQRMLLRYSKQGDLLWALDELETDNNVLYDLVIDDAGGIVGVGTLATNAAIWRWDPNAGPSESWSATYDLPGCTSGARVGRGVAIDSAGNIVLVGHVNDNCYVDGNGQDALVAKYDPSGHLLWVRHYNGPASSHDRANAVAVTSDDSIVVVGMQTNENGEDIWIAKYGA